MINKITIPEKLNSDIWEFCRANNITNIEGFINKILQQGFTAEKFGSVPIFKAGSSDKKIEVKEKIIKPNDKENKTLSKTINSLEKELKEMVEKLENVNAELLKEKNKKDIYGE
jgi:hypothetical protein